MTVLTQFIYQHRATSGKISCLGSDLFCKQL